MAVILKDDKNSLNNSSNFSYSFNYSVCGSNFCPSTELPPSTMPDLNKVYLLLGVYGISTAISVVLGIFLNDIDFLRNKDEKLEFKPIGKFDIIFYF